MSKKKEYTHKDHLGDTLEIGDVVLMTWTEGNGFTTALVVGFTPHKVRLVYERWSNSALEGLKSPSYLVKHPKIPHQDLSCVLEDEYKDYFMGEVCSK